MAAIVTDQFRILNAKNFVDSIQNTDNSYYVFLSLPNPVGVGIGRSTTWDSSIPSPRDDFNYLNHVKNTIIFGRKISPNNIRRVIRKVEWKQGTIYEMYRHDYNINNQSPQTNSSRLYDANYYVINKDYRVYICIDNGSSAVKTSGNFSQDEPTFIDLEPSRAGESGDGYIWKYLFTVSPSDIIKFDSVEYIPIPNNWETSTDAQIQAVRENANSSINGNQIKKIYIQSQGSGYNSTNAELDILGDGTGGKVVVNVDGGKITEAIVSSGGKNYTYGRVDLSSINSGATAFANLIPIIPPSKGHGYDPYSELGSERVLIYSRFDDSTKDFPVDTKFAQIGIIKNPTIYGSDTTVFTDGEFSGLSALKLSAVTNESDAIPGTKIYQSVPGIGTAVGYIASYDTETKVLKYFTDRSLYFNSTTQDQKDSFNVANESTIVSFNPFGGTITSENSFSCTIDANFSGITTSISSSKIVNLSSKFTNGIAPSEINKSSGTILYLDNRPIVTRNPRQKEDIKIILEF